MRIAELLVSSDAASHVDVLVVPTARPATELDHAICRLAVERVRSAAPSAWLLRRQEICTALANYGDHMLNDVLLMSPAWSRAGAVAPHPPTLSELTTLTSRPEDADE
jgi:hypothetical protein